MDLDQRKAVPDGPDPHKRQDGSDGSNPYGSDQYRRQARDGFRDEDGPGPAK